MRQEMLNVIWAPYVYSLFLTGRHSCYSLLFWALCLACMALIAFLKTMLCAQCYFWKRRGGNIRFYKYPATYKRGLTVRSHQTRRDPIQSERIDAYRANFSREETGDKFWFVAPHFRRAQASAFTRICGATNSLKLKYLNFDANFISVQHRGHWVTCVT